jgi:hypothetical protein
MSRSTRLALLGTLLAALGSAACDKVPLLAPTNSTIRLTASVGIVPANGSIDITAIVIEAGGTPVQNGTVVTFSSSLGTIEPREGRTSNGQVTVKYLAGGQSGRATLSAFSGGTKSDDLEVLVGAAAAAAVTLRADTTVLPSTGGTTALYATVLDTGGNPLRSVPVSFSASTGQVTPGTAVTNEFGEARTDLFTTTKSTVTARVVGGGASGGGGGNGGGTPAPSGATATLDIEVRDVPIIDLAGGTRTAGQPVTWEVGVPIGFTLTPKTGGNAVRSAVVAFGDGNTRNVGAILAPTSLAHTYNQTGLFTATVTATDVLNFVGSTSIGVTIMQKRTIPVTIVVRSNLAGLVTFDANTNLVSAEGLPTIIVNEYQWDFGDGTSTTTSGSSATHRYGAGNFTVRLRVVSTFGHEGFAEFVVRTTSS